MGLLLLTYNLVSIAILVSPVRRQKEDSTPMWWEESWSQSKGDLFSPILDKPSSPTGSQILYLLVSVTDDLDGSSQVSGDLTDAVHCFLP